MTLCRAMTWGELEPLLHATETNLQHCALQASCPSLCVPSMGAEPWKEDLCQASYAWEKNHCSSLFQVVIRVATVPRQGKEGVIITLSSPV